MQALTVIPGQEKSAILEDRGDPEASEGAITVETIAVGVCGTDLEILAGKYGWPSPGKKRLVLGHESIGRVTACPSHSALNKGDLVVGIVRHPDPVPCVNCAAGEWDMCRNGQYRERGIKEMDGFCRETYRSNEDFLVKVSPHLGIAGVLVEPASILAKAWEQIEYIGARATWRPERCLITGAGAIGLLAAMMARQHNLHVDVLDLVTEGPKPQLVRDIGANYHVSGVSELAKTADIVIECTGVGRLVFDILTETPPGAITCLTGISSGGRTIPADISSLNKTMVLENDVVFGSVNANRRHYQKAAAALEAADVTWLRRIINRSVPLADWREATCRQPDDVKTIVQLAAV